MTKVASFHQADVTRALNRITKAGLKPKRVEVRQDAIVVLLDDQEAAEQNKENEWDEVLK